MNNPGSAIPFERIAGRVAELRGRRVILSPDLAQLYGIEPRALVPAVKRNRERFPADFMFQLTSREFEILKSQIVISSWGGLRRANPYAFTEQGVAMLSGLVNSPRAILVNIAIMRAFVQMRQAVAWQLALRKRPGIVESKCDERYIVFMDAMSRLLAPREGRRERIGFHPRGGRAGGKGKARPG